MPTVEYIAAAIENYKTITIVPGENIELFADEEFRIGLGQYFLSFTGWDAEAVANTWSASNNPLFKEIEATADGDTLTLTHTVLGQDFELTISAGGDNVLTSSAKQKISFSPAPSGGTFTLSDGTETTGVITWSATPATLITNITNAINALTAYVSGDVTVTHVAGDYFLDFSTGGYAGLPIPTWTGNFTSLTGGNAAVTITTTQNGNVGSHEIVELSFPGDGTHTENLNDIQLLTPDNNTEGEFTLTVPTFGTTNSIPYNAGRSLIKSKLETVVGIGNVKVTGGPLAEVVPGETTSPATTLFADGHVTTTLDTPSDCLTWDDTNFALSWGRSTSTSRNFYPLICFTLDAAQGDTVEYAALRLFFDNFSGTLVGELRAADDDNPAWPTDAEEAEDLINGPLTTAYTSIGGTALASGNVLYDVTSIVQEILNRPGWVAGNRIIFTPNITSGGANISASIASADTFADPEEVAPALAVTTISSGSVTTNPVTVEFVGSLAGQDIDEMTIASSTLDDGLTISTEQEGGSTTVENIVGGTFTLKIVTPTNTFYVVAPYDVDNATLESLIEANTGLSCTVTGGPAPSTLIEIEFEENLAITVSILLGLETNFDSSVLVEQVREFDIPHTPENVWDLTVVPGAGTLGVRDDDPNAYIILRIQEPVSAAPTVAEADEQNDIYIRLFNISADRIEDAINEAFGRDVVRVTRIVHSQEWGNVNIGTTYGDAYEEPLYFWWMHDVFRLVFINEFEAPGTILNISVSTPDDAGPAAWLVAPAGLEGGMASDIPDATYESDRVYFGFVYRESADPIHQFSAVRYEEAVDNRLSYKVKLLSQYGSANGVQGVMADGITRTGIARQLVDQTVTFSWGRLVYGGGENPSLTVLDTVTVDWDSSPETITTALEELFGEGNVLVEGSLFNSYLSEFDRDVADEQDAYNDLRITLIRALAHLPLNEHDYTLSASISNSLPENSVQSRAFLCISEPYTKPMPPYVNSRYRITAQDVEALTALQIIVNGEAVTIPLNSTASAISSLLNTALGTIAPTFFPTKYRNSVTVNGTDLSNPIDIEFTGCGLQFTDGTIDVAIQTTDEVALLEVTQEGAPPTPEIQVVTISGSPRAGTFTLTSDEGTTSALAYNTNAAAIEAALEAEAVYTGLIAVTGTNPFTVTFAATLGNQSQMTSSLSGMHNASGTVGVEQVGGSDATLVIRESVEGSGPLYMDCAANYSTGEVFSSEDTLVFDDATSPVRFGIKQQSFFTVASIADNLLRYTRLRSVFKDGQKVWLRGTGTPPAGLTFDSYYYIINQDDDFTFQLSGTHGGAAVNITSVGSGEFELLIKNPVITVYNRYTGSEIGLPNIREGNVNEYLPCYMVVGGPDVEAGIGEGSGMTMFRLNTLDLESHITIKEAGQSSMPNVPAVLLLFDNVDSTLTIEDGDVGIAVYHEETSTLKSIEMTGGSLLLNNTTVIDDFTAGDNDITIRNSTIGGTVAT